MARWIKDTIADQRRSPEGWGALGQVRTYVEGQGARDVRTGLRKDLQGTLDGDLDDFLRAALAQRT